MYFSYFQESWGVDNYLKILVKLLYLNRRYCSQDFSSQSQPLSHIVFASGHAGPRIFWGPAKNPRPAPHRTAGWGGGSFFFRPAPCPVRGLALPGSFFFRPAPCPVQGPALPGPRFRFPPQIPRSGAPFFAGHPLGPH